ncbi:polycystic kidney disease 2 1 protein isoform X1, partial [Biomphalaria glabrata]
VRRIVTGVTMLQTLMITNLMFFGLQDVDDARQFTTILGFTIHLTRILIMIQTSVIFTTIGVIVAFLFNRAAPKPSKEIEDELTEEEKELVQTNIERIVFNTAHPVNIERKHSEHNKTQQLRNTSLFGMWFGSNESSLREKTTSQSTLHLDESPKNIFLDIEAAESEIEQSHIDLLNCFQLPWWFIYITWILLTLYNVFLAYYIMLYGLSLGYEKSVDWTIGFLTSVLTDVIIFQPVKVVLIAFIVILVLKQKYSLRDQAPIAKHKECLELLFHSQTIRKKIGLKRTNVVYQIPLNATDFKEVLERLKVESLAREMMRDFVLYIIFMFCILLVVYGNLDVFTRYQQIQYTQNVYLGIRESRGENDEGVNFLADIKEHSQIWDYLKEVLLVRIAPNEKGNNLPESSYLLGPARFRQARVVPDSGVCNDLPETIRTIYNTEFCIYSMDYGKEETRSYVHTWETLYEGDAEDLEESSYVYKSAEQLRTASFTGQHGTYSGGGFVVNMSREDLKLAQQTLQNIQDSDWLDQHTRCIFVEFTLYNPSSDLFTNVILAFEFDVTGGIFPYYSVSAARFYLTNARKDNWLQIAEGITAICAVFYTVLELYIAIDKGITNYLTNFWNCLEVFVLLLSYIVGILYLARQVAYLQAIDTFNLFGHARFIDFQTVFYRTFLFNTSISALGALAIFKMLKVLTFNPFLVTYTKTMETIQSGFIAFTGISAIYLLAFAFSGMLIFGPYVFGYMSLDRALFNLLFFILGEADYDNIIADNIVLGPTYFLIVMLVTQYIIMNFYVAILREGLELARYMSFEKENATIKYMFRVLLLSLGMAPQNIRRALSDFL